VDEELTQWTAWLAMGALGASAAASLRAAPAQAAAERLNRWLWTLACGLLVIHVVCAFQFQHHWSHAAAYAHTARQTAEYVGLEWGGGLYFNYLLLLVWTGDVAWWWIGPQSYRKRPAFIAWFVNGFLTFMVFNAAVVFAEGPLRWLALGVMLILGAWGIRR
jgi:hypothetical protein